MLLLLLLNTVSVLRLNIPLLMKRFTRRFAGLRRMLIQSRDPEKIALGGDSAGGDIAAVVSRKYCFS